MSDFSSCPGCGARASQSVFGGSFRVFQCSHCLRYYCHKCPGSNDARNCPKCGSKDAVEKGKVN
jgi:hypothetical protein